MNERINQLAREAGFYANPDVEKFEKFAELIVAESIDWLAMNEEDAKALREHFGVKE